MDGSVCPHQDRHSHRFLSTVVPSEDRAEDAPRWDGVRSFETIECESGTKPPLTDEANLPAVGCHRYPDITSDYCVRRASGTTHQGRPSASLTRPLGSARSRSTGGGRLSLGFGERPFTSHGLGLRNPKNGSRGVRLGWRALGLLHRRRCVIARPPSGMTTWRNP
jgi:hypothetical protein